MQQKIPVKKSIKEVLQTNTAVLCCWLLGIVGWGLMPWYLLEDGFFSFQWLTEFFSDANLAPASLQLILAEKPWIGWYGGFLFLQGLAVAYYIKNHDEILQKKGSGGLYLTIISAASLLYIVLQGYAIGVGGLSFQWLENAFANFEGNQYGYGWGALLSICGCIGLLACGISDLKKVNADRFTVLVALLTTILIFTFIVLPLFYIFIQGFLDEDANFSFNNFFAGLGDPTVWSAFFNSTKLALLVATVSTLLGFIMAIAMERLKSNFFLKSKIFLILPIITPPFVVGLAIILLFGRAGAVTIAFADLFGIEPSRYIYGFYGIALAQIISMTPIAILAIAPILNGIGPSLEEASSTLGTSNFRTFFRITVPLTLPGLSAAFLIVFIESVADFGNPLILGGEYEVLSTEIFFSIVGAQYDLNRASILAIILLTLTVGIFFFQRYRLSKKSFVTITGKGDSGKYTKLSAIIRVPVVAVSLFFMTFTVIIYGMIMFGGIVKTWGYDHTFTLAHYIDTFNITTGKGGLVFSGKAWESLFTTFEIAFLAAPLTALVGILAAWLFARNNFRFKNILEFGTLMSFAIPGTVIGISYILAFNKPPIELTGTGIILLACFVFRNMPVGLRSGIAALSQIDKSLDEAATILGSSSANVFKKIIVPLIKPSIFTAISYGFVRSITAISAVIFLVSAEFSLATVFIINQLDNSAYGIAIVYSSTLIVLMSLVLFVMNLLIGRSNIRKQKIEINI